MSAEEQMIKEIGTTVRALGSFIAKHVDAPIEEATGIIIDSLKYIRWERQQRLHMKAIEFLKGKEPTKELPLNFAVPLLQAATLEENNDLQDIWAKLLVNAVTSEPDSENRHAFISILKDLTPLDAQLLNKLYSSREPYDYTAVWSTNLPEQLSIERPEGDNLSPPEEVMLSLANLSRLGLITVPATYGGVSGFSYLSPTLLGWRFYLAIA
jgi:hypothetical protein